MALTRYEHAPFPPRRRSAEPRPATAARAWSPRVDIRELPDRYVVSADVPGVDPKDISITLDAGVLTVTGRREPQTEAGPGTGYERLERARGSFERRFSLPESANGECISARANAGVLSIEIPKAEQVLARRIEVKH